MEKEMNKPEKLVVLWTSNDKDVAIKMALMYTYNSKVKGWWQDVTLIVWGPTAKLVAEDKEIQDYIQKIMGAGIEVLACKACSDMYGVSKNLEDMGINVLYVGSPFTDLLKDERCKVISV